MNYVNWKFVSTRRERVGITQQACADRAGLSVQHWANLESGQVDNPRIETLMKIATAIECSVEDMLVKPYRIPGRTPKAKSATVRKRSKTTKNG